MVPEFGEARGANAWCACTQNGRRNGNANVIMRSVPSTGPSANSTQGGKARVNGKAKPQVDTARARRAKKRVRAPSSSFVSSLEPAHGFRLWTGTF